MLEFKFLDGKGLLIIYLSLYPLPYTVPVLSNYLLNKYMLNKYFFYFLTQPQDLTVFIMLQNMKLRTGSLGPFFSYLLLVQNACISS